MNVQMRVPGGVVDRPGGLVLHAPAEQPAGGDPAPLPHLARHAVTDPPFQLGERLAFGLVGQGTEVGLPPKTEQGPQRGGALGEVGDEVVGADPDVDAIPLVGAGPSESIRVVDVGQVDAGGPGDPVEGVDLQPVLLASSVHHARQGDVLLLLLRGAGQEVLRLDAGGNRCVLDRLDHSSTDELSGRVGTQLGAGELLAGPGVHAVGERPSRPLAGLVQRRTGHQPDLGQTRTEPDQTAVLDGSHPVVGLSIAGGLVSGIGLPAVQAHVTAGVPGEAVLDLLHVHDPTDPGHPRCRPPSSSLLRDEQIRRVRPRGDVPLSIDPD